MQIIENKQLRPNIKHPAIVSQLKSDIVQGVFLPGAKLPTRTEMEERFGVSNMTMQLVMDHLRRDGFVNTNGRNGTTVAEFPPHLYHYGLVFYGKPRHGTLPWTRFWDALHQESQVLSDSGPRKIMTYMGISGHVDDPDRIRLLADIRAQRLAGVLFVQLFDSICEPIIAQAPALPCVSVAATSQLNVPLIKMGSGFMTKALDALQQRGRKRIAFITGPRINLMDGLDQMLAQRGMRSEPFWEMEFHLDLPGPAKSWMELLMRFPQAQRPDGLVITDDNLVEAATMGIASAGVRVPEQLDVVALCNFPWVTPSIVPARRLGYDARRVLAFAISCIDQKRQGLTPPSCTLIPLQFEHEVSKAVNENMNPNIASLT